MNMLRTSLAAAVAAASTAASPAAFAIPITQIVTRVGDGFFSVTADVMQGAFNNPINLFNAAAIAAANPGFTVSLTDVKLQFQVQATILGTLRNTGSQAQRFPLTESVAAFLDGNSANTPTAVTSNFGAGSPASISVTFPTVVYENLAAGASATYLGPFGATQTGNGGPLTFTDAATLAAFTGSSAFTLGLSTLTRPIFIGGGGNISTSLFTTAGGSTFAVTYDYMLSAIPVPVPTTNPVPEPTTIALLGSGLLGLGLVRRRKND